MVQDSGNVYGVVELVGSSPDGLEAAIQGAIARAAEVHGNLDWFEVKEIRGRVEGADIGWYQVKVLVGYRMERGSNLAST